MNGERVANERVLALIASQKNHGDCDVLLLHCDAIPTTCSVREQLRQQATRYTRAVSSRLAQLTLRKREPEADWQQVDIHNALSRQRISQPGFDWVILPNSASETLLWRDVLKPGGWLLYDNGDDWLCWRNERGSEPFPLTDIQHAYWLGRTHTLALGGISCHVCFEWRIDNFDIARFEQAWNKVITRHAMMRACVNDDGLQHILPEVPWYPIRVSDWRGDAPSLQQQKLLEKRGQLSEQVLDASCWPLFDLQATRLSDRETRVHLDLDLLTFDVQSFHIVLAELESNYHQPERQLPPLSWTFRDYQLAEVRDKASLSWRNDRDWWLARLDEISPAPILPLACQPDQLTKPEFRRLQRRVDSQHWQRLTQHAAQVGVTSSAMLLAVFSEVLTGWAESGRFTLNLTHFNRHPWHADVAEMVGDFTAVLLLSVDCSQSMPFAERAQRIQQALRERLAHSRFGGIDLLREKAKRDSLSESTLMPVVFTSLLGMDLDRLVEGANLLGEPEWLYTATPQVWLDHQVMVRKGTLEYNWIVIDNLFPAGMIDEMFAVYGERLDALCDAANWQQPLGNLLSSRQAVIRQQVNHTNQSLTLKPLHAGFFQQVEQRPNACALITAKGSLSYAELAQKALQVAAALRPFDVENHPVVVSLPKSAEQIIAALGVMAAGAILVPAATDWPRARLLQVINNAEARAVILADVDPLLATEVPVLILEDLPAAQLAPLMPPLNQLAYIIYTSGSTGTPKGVAMQHGATANTLADLCQRLSLGPDDRVFGISSLSFDLAIFDLFATLDAGATLVLPHHTALRDASAWLGQLTAHQVTVWNSVPALMAMLLEQVTDQTQLNLRVIMLSGDWFKRELAERIAIALPKTRILALGGATEAAIWSNLMDATQCDARWHAVPYGYPLSNQRYYILDEQGRDRPAGVAGDLCIAGAGLAQGYWKDSARTEQAFFWSHRHQQRLYRTGDLARYDVKGCIEFLGRRDRQIKLNGYRIELSEIEQTLISHPSVSNVAVDIVTRESGAAQLLAWVVPHSENAHLQNTAWRQVGDVAAQQLPSATEIASLAAFQAESESLAPLMIWQLLHEMAFIESEGWVIEEARQRAGIAACFGRLLERWHSILEEEGIIELRGQRWFAAECAPSLLSIEQRIDDGKTRLGRCLAWHAQGETFLHWLFASQHTMIEVMREPRLANSLLFPDGESSVSEALYQRNKLADYLGHIAATLLQAAVQNSEHPQVLEIGAGIGGLTASTLPAFNAAGTGHYYHTDVSPWFSRYAEQRFGQYSALRTGRYDINQPLDEQGWQPAGFDAVLAANVLHNAHRLDVTLSDIWRLLKPGGALIVLEATQDKALQWVTAAAVLEQAAEDHSQQDSPLLARDVWHQAFQRNGFVEVGEWPQADMPLAFAGQQVFMVRRPAGVTDEMTLQTRIQQHLPSYMLPEQLIFVPRIPLSVNGKHDLSALPRPTFVKEEKQSAAGRPLTPAETELAGHWQALLSIEQVNADEDFFRSGGDSLLATQLTARLSRHYDMKVPIGLIFSHSKLCDMAQALEALSNRALNYPLLALNSGGEQTLICLHASDGDSAAWGQVAARLQQVHCVGVQSPGFSTDERPLNDIPAQAKRALHALREEGFKMPWHLAGWSMGAAVVIEMAWQLQLEGEHIASLTLVDPLPPQSMQACAADEYGLWQSMASQAQKHEITSFEGMDRAQRLRAWRSVLSANFQGDDHVLERRIAVVQSNVQAMCTAPVRQITDLTVNIIAADTRATEWGDSFAWLTPQFPQGSVIEPIADANHWTLLTRPECSAVLQRICGGRPR
ncbi:amino acid adenylation domain-containing protein [Pantoea sp. Acro-805]|uniref:Amino acid adenylation domain-containing protein n=1 Tax=Candidatus Pantoea formicae TaxID=2608355 RepID=A0ABX0QPV6_9GAMM|nr:non-ribosomal peptide synthetase [Pantoea formicae]NIE99097.1 amino acid adenylation domain-containing protein [Pantoea formicae]